MDFGFTDEQAALRSKTIDFARSELDTDLVAADAGEHFDRTRWQKCADFGILGSYMPEEYGGLGMDLVTTMVMLEALGYGCPDNGLTLALNAQLWAVQAPLIRFGTEEQKQRLLPGLVAGTLLGADGVTEESAGSDAYSMQTSAIEADGGHVLNGRKSYISMGPASDFALVFATSDPDLGRWGISAFIVDADSPGFTTESRSKMGSRTAPFGDLILDEVFVKADDRLGPKGAGASIFNHVMNWERSFILASHVGSMQRQLDENAEFARTRRQFGEPIGRFQSVANRIADMRLRLETSQLLLYKAAWVMDTGEDAQMASALAKLHIAESFIDSSIDSIRNHGARGYLPEFGIERDLRDAVGDVILGGTSDIQRRSIARLLGL